MDFLINLGLVLFFIGFALIAIGTSVYGIGESYMKENNINQAKWFLNPKYILQYNTLDNKKPRKPKFKEPKNKHIFYNFFEFIIYYSVAIPHFIMFIGIVLFCVGKLINLNFDWKINVL